MGPRLRSRDQATGREPHYWPHRSFLEGLHIAHCTYERHIYRVKFFVYPDSERYHRSKDPDNSSSAVAVCFMGPRKRSKLNPKAETEPVSEELHTGQGPNSQSKDSSSPAVVDTKSSEKPESVEPVHSSGNGLNTVSAEDGQPVHFDTNLLWPQLSKTWYGGTWPRGNKANPVTQVARESIQAAGGAASEAPASARAHTQELPTTPLKSPTLYLSKGIASSSRTLPLAATTTKLNITSSAKSSMNGPAEDGKVPKSKGNPPQEQKTEKGFSAAPEAAKPDDATLTTTSKTGDDRPETKHQALEVSKAANESASWLNWFSKSDIATDDETNTAHPDDNADGANKPHLQGTTFEALQDSPTSHKQRRNSEPSPVTRSVQQEVPRSWFSLWGNASTQTNISSSASAIGVASNPQVDSNRTESPNVNLVDAELGPVSAPQPPQQLVDGTKTSYGWAFWSRDQPKNDDEKTRSGSENGELALARSSSQTKPESAVVDNASGLPDKAGKRQRPLSPKVAESFKKSHGNRDDAQRNSKPEIIPLAPKVKAKVDAGLTAKRMPDNLFLPSLRNTYSTVERPSLIQQISRFLQVNSSSKPQHVDIVHNPPRIKRALAIVSFAFSVNHGSLLHG